MTVKQWRDVYRVVHLTGGLRAKNEPGPHVTIPITNTKSVSLSISEYHDLPITLEDMGLGVIGIDYYEMNEQIQGYIPPTWQVLSLID